MIHAPKRGAHRPALNAASPADGRLTEWPPRCVSTLIPNPRAEALRIKEEGAKTRVAALGESGAQKQGKGERTKLG